MHFLLTQEQGLAAERDFLCAYPPCTKRIETLFKMLPIQVTQTGCGIARFFHAYTTTLTNRIKFAVISCPFYAFCMIVAVLFFPL